MTFEQNMRTFTGCSISAMALTLTGLGVDALGVNCSLGPKELEPVIEELVKWTNLPIIVKPNAGLPDPETNLYNVTAAQFADFMKDLRKYGIKIFGGCCGTNPEFIKELSEMLKEKAIRQHHTNIFRVQCVQQQALLSLMSQELSVKESILQVRSF